MNRTPWHQQTLDDFLAPSLARDFPNLPISHAQGTYVYSTDGRAFLDFVAGMASCNVGHCHPVVVRAIQQQAERLIHGPVGVLLYESVVELSNRLQEVLPPGLDCFFFGNSGTEAVEGSIKLARFVTGRPNVIAFHGAFHGRTLGSVSLTASKARYRRHTGPLPAGVYHAPYPYVYRSPWPDDPEECAAQALAGVDAIFRHVAEPSSVAAILVEPVQGEGGYIVPPASFLKGLRERCDEHGILLIFDEIQTGFGRTGNWFAAQTFDVRPDIMALAKGIASGMPLSVIAASKELMEQWLAGSHGTTFGGNPLSCAAALATLDVIVRDNLLERARVQGEALMAGLRSLQEQFDFIGDVRGAGLMIGVELVNSRETKEPAPQLVGRVLEGALQRGLILYPAGTSDQVIRFIPPLTLSDEELVQALDIFGQALAAAAQVG
ncbi:MAG TPA: aspartate aminotransferase family protein [Sphingobacteriaceae bacterium]|nr:aspartate aminotransferase family protein [Sphingobacteriaceae bacterium]